MHRLSPYDQGELWYGLGYSEDNFLEGTPSTHTYGYTSSMHEFWAGFGQIVEGTVLQARPLTYKALVCCCGRLEPSVEGGGRQVERDGPRPQERAARQEHVGHR